MLPTAQCHGYRLRSSHGLAERGDHRLAPGPGHKHPASRHDHAPATLLENTESFLHGDGREPVLPAQHAHRRESALAGMLGKQSVEALNGFGE
jgi:hypothetical protein